MLKSKGLLDSSHTSPPNGSCHQGTRDHLFPPRGSCFSSATPFDGDGGIWDRASRTTFSRHRSLFFCGGGGGRAGCETMESFQEYALDPMFFVGKAMWVVE